MLVRILPISVMSVELREGPLGVAHRPPSICLISSPFPSVKFMSSQYRSNSPKASSLLRPSGPHIKHTVLECFDDSHLLSSSPKSRFSCEILLHYRPNTLASLSLYSLSI